MSIGEVTSEYCSRGAGDAEVEEAAGPMIAMAFFAFYFLFIGTMVLVGMGGRVSGITKTTESAAARAWPALHAVARTIA